MRVYGCLIGAICVMCGIVLFVAAFNTGFIATAAEVERARIFFILGIVAMILGLVFPIIGIIGDAIKKKPRKPVESEDEFEQKVKKESIKSLDRGRKYSSLEGEGSEEKIHWYCSECATEISETEKTCPKCGAEFE